jgi:hypothetical protein
VSRSPRATLTPARRSFARFAVAVGELIATARYSAPAVRRAEGRATRRPAWHSALLLIVALLVLPTIVTACGAKKKSATRAPATGVSVAELTRFSSSVGHPVYWAGAQPGSTYELSRTKDGRVFVRYLPSGAKLGDPKPKYLAVGTYPQANAFAVLKATAKKQGVKTTRLRGGGLAFADKTHPTSVYLAYPGSNYQIEVYDPSPARALRLVVSGKVVPIGVAAAGRAPATRATAAQLKALASRLGHPLYWAGTRADATYEVTRTSDARVYVRYLPPGVRVGDQRPNFLTVGTYPLTGAFAAVKRIATKSDSPLLKVAGGGIATIDKHTRTSAYLAYPGADYEIEVYDPDASVVRQLVTSGAITPVG